MPSNPQPRVFVVQQPTQRDPDTGAIVPSMDLSPANEYGRLIYLLRDFENPFSDPQASASRVAQALRAEHYDGEIDYLLLVGNPALIGLVAAVACEVGDGFIRMLQWDRARRRYAPVPVIDVYDADDPEKPVAQSATT